MGFSESIFALPVAAFADIPPTWLAAPAGAVLALIFAIYFYKKVMAAPEGTEKMIAIARYVREGAYAYLFRQYSVVALVFLILLIILGACAYLGVQNPFVPVAFLTGGFFSGLCGFLGMKTATNASSRTAQGASESLNRGLQVAFRSGAVMGLTDAFGLPIAVDVTSASPHEITLVDRTLDACFVENVPEKNIGDRAYDSDKLDKSLAKERGIELIAPHKNNRVKPTTQDGRILRRYKKRWKVEHLFA